jgi:hypothetical protein
MIDPAGEESADATLPLCQEVAWDYENNKPIFRRGRPVMVTGKEAVEVWIWKALYTARYRYEIYSWDYGSEFESLIGQAYSDTLKTAEAPRYLKECLLINPYITAVKNITVAYEDNRLTVEGTAETVYGEVSVHATV